MPRPRNAVPRRKSNSGSVFQVIQQRGADPAQRNYFDPDSFVIGTVEASPIDSLCGVADGERAVPRNGDC